MRSVQQNPHRVKLTGILLLFVLTLFVISPSVAQETRADYLEGIRKNENMDEYVYSLTRLSELYRFKKPDSARLLIQKALEVSEKENFTEGIIRSYNALGNLEVAQNNNTVALQHLKKVLAYEDEVKQKIFFASTYNALGLVMAELTDYQQAIQYYQKSYDILKEYKSKDYHENVLANIGIMHFELYNFEKGFEYFDRVLKIKQKKGDKRGELMVMVSMATANANRKNYARAQKFYLTALHLADSLDLEFRYGLISGNLGKIYYLEGKPDSAFKLLKISIPILTEKHARSPLITDLGYMARIYALKGNRQKAFEYLDRAKALQIETQGIENKRELMAAYTEVYENLGDYADALEYKDLLIEIKDSIFSQEQKERITMLETRFDVQQKEHQIDLQQLEISKQRQTSAFLFGGLIALGIIIVLVVMQYFRTRKKNKYLTAKNLELMQAEKENSDLQQEARKYIDAKKDALVEELETLMNSEKIYRDPKISIEELSARLNTNRTYLSNIINSHFNCNFKTFINRHRISEARHLLIKPGYRNYTIEAIAGEVGFASKSAFNFVFKKETGLTPSVFQKNALKISQPEPVLN